MTSKVFISYRRSDSKYPARMIHAAFCQAIPKDHVFMDVDTIEPGTDFREIIKGWVNQCNVLLALIGPDWVNAVDPKTKMRRLDNPDDFVRIEISQALRRGIAVIPVLLDGTVMPDAGLMPRGLKKLVGLQAVFVEDRTFDGDVARLIRKVGLAAVDPQDDIKGPTLMSTGTDWRGAQVERYEQGIHLRQQTPLERHANLVPRDPAKILAASDRERVLPELAQQRYQRMLTSPFAFLRGAAALMAQDLRNEPTAGIPVQACGDCHLMNFGASLTPERKIYFDINNFEQTLPGVDFTVDLKRLVASVAVAAPVLDSSSKRARAAAAATISAYRLQMEALARLSPFEIRNSKIDLAQEVSQIEDPKLRKKLKAFVKTAVEPGSPGGGLVRVLNGNRIADKPPLLSHPAKDALTQYALDFQALSASYKKSLPPESLRVFEQYTFRDAAFITTGVGSVGSIRFILLFTSKDGAPLLLEFKQATTSVLECLGPKFDGHAGQRVAAGQRILEATRDIFLGWADNADRGRQFYVHQMKNHALGVLREATDIEDYARLCAKTLACAHARSADPAVIAGYMGEDDTFEDALASFAMVYATRTQEDFNLMAKTATRGTPKPEKRR